MKYYFLKLILACGCLMLWTRCSNDNGSDPDRPDPEVEIPDPTAIAKTNQTKMYMHFMTWFETKESSGNGQWGYHWTMSNKNPDVMDSDGKREIASYFYPLTGPYHSGDPDVIDYQLLLMKYAGVDGVLIDWYGTYDVNDYRMIFDNTEVVREHLLMVGLDYAIVYEDRFLQQVVEAGKAPTQLSAGKNDMRYLDREMFADENYIEIDGKPLLLCFGPVTLQTEEEWTDMFSVFEEAPEFFTLWYESGDAGVNATGEYSWVYEDNSHLKDFYEVRAPELQNSMGSAYPGFVDFYEEGGAESSIGFTIPHNGGETLNETLQMASGSELLQLITWNDYGEGTILEPTHEFGFDYVNRLQTYAGVQASTEVFEGIFKWFQLRKKYASDREVQHKLDDAFAWFAAAKPEKALEIINGI
ncbi:glycoside hydrolase family 71/99-like protein [Robertkochia solimangrovi]|uniref:glycoside hydrolase family 71/99-like protein n=1 Tax=Robertkochia solimangrovi TaxID=2213046 RepID=UPI00117D65C7|nr:glycoside hydrolase family 71/99-like protein [Robertkochia solimangrovi]TRZ45749.1 hypothetical protein DMZ48_00255 [Robertkochia solimangrovi]